MRSYFRGAVAAMAWLGAGSAALANPAYTLTIQDSAGSTTQTDNGTGTISYSGTLGGFTISAMSVTDLSTTNPLDVAFGSQDIFSATTSDTLNVYVTVSNLPASAPTMLTIGTTSQANFQGSRILGWSTQTYFDPGNRTGIAGTADLLSGESGGLVRNGFLTTTEASALLTSSPFSYTVEYSLRLMANEYANGAGASTDVILSEPGSLIVLMAGLSLVAIMRHRRFGTAADLRRG
jgi:hypothetical protein